MVHAVRDLGDVRFVLLRMAEGVLQCVAGEGVVPACRFRRPTDRQVQFVYFIVFGSRRRITFGAMDHAPAGKRKRGAVSAP